MLRTELENLIRGMAWHLDYMPHLFVRMFHNKKLPRKIRRIVIAELLFPGDVIVTTPIYRLLKNRFTNVRISVMLLPQMKDVLACNPNVDEIVTCNRKDLENCSEEVIKMIKGAELGIILRPGYWIMSSWQMSRLLKKAGVRFRIGSTRVGLLEGRGFFLHRKTRPTFRLKHKVEDHLDVLRSIGIKGRAGLELYTTKEAETDVKRMLRNHGILNNDRVICMHAMPQHQSHKWLDERFAELADRLSKEGDIVFSGSDRDIKNNDNIMGLMKGRAVNMAGTTMQQFFALIKRSSLVISVDTSTMHVAAAFNVPVVALFGAGNPNIWKPYSKNSIAIHKKRVCTGCMRHRCPRKGMRHMECMKAITVEDVLLAMDMLGVTTLK